MSWRDAIGLAARGLRRQPGRAALTVLAVALAASLLTALLTIAGTAQTKVLDQLAKGGPLSGIRVAAAAPDPLQVGQDNARPGRPRVLDDDALHRIGSLPNVRTALPVITADVFVVEPATTPDGEPLETFNDTVVGVDLSKPSLLPISVLAGRLPANDATAEIAVTQSYLQRVGLKRTEAARVVGTELEMAAARTFLNDDRTPDGDRRIRGLWTRAVIVGVVAQDAASGELLAPLPVAQRAHNWISASVADDVPDAARSPYSGAFVVANGIDNITSVRAGITAIGFSTSAPENLIASVRRYLRVVEIVLAGIGTVALVVATLGIANAMLASVRERRREIGVLKAIGARDRDVQRIFVVEAAATGFVGGAVGTVLGWLIALTVAAVVNGYLAGQGLQTVHVQFPILIGVLGLGGSTLLAVLGGTVPARRAARQPARAAVAAT